MKNIDIKLLDLLCTLVDCQNPAEAARRLDITPSAVSQSMSRLRETFGDPLHVRQGAGYELTPLGHQVIGSVAEIVGLWKSLQENTVPFAPCESDAHLVVALHDTFGDAAPAALLRTAMLEAPWMTIDTHVRCSTQQDISALRDGSLDMLCGPMIELPDGAMRDLRFETVGRFDITHVCVSALHPRINRSLSMAQYLAESHLRVATAASAGEAPDPVDAGLWRQGLAKRRCSTVSSWALCAELLANSERLTTVTRHQACALTQADPRIRALPLPQGHDWPSHTVQMVWHERTNHSPAHRWLRDKLRSVLGAPDALAQRFAGDAAVVPATVQRPRHAIPSIALVASNA
ncbi:MAG: LysR family transcriptional regulator [Comamonadaceae bacterium]|nr:MAG: LysR family transcriptional regulator [Comamonadaceae bacterium]